MAERVKPPTSRMQAVMMNGVEDGRSGRRISDALRSRARVMPASRAAIGKRMI